MSYRPSLRMDVEYQKYINQLFHATFLDRNQLIRAALFVAAYSDEYRSLIGRHRRQPDVPLPFPSWQPSDHRYWMEQSISDKKGGDDVNDARLSGAGAIEETTKPIERKRNTHQEQQPGRVKQEAGREREIHKGGYSRTISTQGGIQIRLG